MSIPDELRNIRDHLRSGSFGQREVWEQQLEQAAAEAEAASAGALGEQCHIRGTLNRARA